MPIFGPIAGLPIASPPAQQAAELDVAAYPIAQTGLPRDRRAPATGRASISNYPWYFELDFDFSVPGPQFQYHRDRRAPAAGRVHVSNYPWFYELDFDFGIPAPQLNVYRARYAPAAGRAGSVQGEEPAAPAFDAGGNPWPQLSTFRDRTAPARGHQQAAVHPWYFELDFDFTVPAPQFNVWRDRRSPAVGRALASNYPWYFELDFNFAIPVPPASYWRDRSEPASGRASVSNYPWSFEVDFVFLVPVTQLSRWHDRRTPAAGRAQLSDQIWRPDPEDPAVALTSAPRAFQGHGQPLPLPGRAAAVEPWFEIVPWPLLHGAEAASTVPPGGPPERGAALFTLADVGAGFGTLPDLTPAPQSVRPGPVPCAGRAGNVDGHQLTPQTVEDYGAGVLDSGRRPRDGSRGSTGRAGAENGLREWTLDGLIVGWAGETARQPVGRQPHARTVALIPAQPPEQTADPLWFAPGQRTPAGSFRLAGPPHSITCPWHPLTAIVVAGPFWVCAGMIAAAAGAVQGELRTVREP